MKIIIANSNTWFHLSEKLANRNEILHIKEKESFTIENINRFNPELIFFPHWSWIVPKEIYTNFKCILFHTAPLPFGRGGSPIQNLIINGFKESPVCALKMTSDIDAGPIYTKKQLSLEGSLKEIFKNLNLSINEMINELIFHLPNPKDQTGKTLIFKRLKKEDNELPKTLSIEEIFDRIRMLDYENYPNTFIKHGEFKFEFYDAELIEGNIICTTKIVPNND